MYIIYLYININVEFDNIVEYIFSVYMYIKYTHIQTGVSKKQTITKLIKLVRECIGCKKFERFVFLIKEQMYVKKKDIVILSFNHDLTF